MVPICFLGPIYEDFVHRLQSRFNIHLTHQHDISECHIKGLPSHIQIVFLNENLLPLISSQTLKSLFGNFKTVLIGADCAYETIRYGFLCGAFDVIKIPFPSPQFEWFCNRLEKSLENNPETNVDLAQAIASHFIHVKPLEEDLINRYWFKYKRLDRNNQYTLSFVAKQLEPLYKLLPIEPLYVRIPFITQGLARWIQNDSTPQDCFKHVLISSQKSYEDIFLPFCKDDLVAQIRHILLENKSKITTVDALSKALFVNRSYLSHTFKAKTGISLSAYIIRLKMYAARVFFITTEHSIHDVMELLSYKDYGYFCKLFYEHTGCHPKNYILQVKGHKPPIHQEV